MIPRGKMPAFHWLWRNNSLPFGRINDMIFQLDYTNLDQLNTLKCENRKTELKRHTRCADLYESLQNWWICIKILLPFVTYVDLIWFIFLIEFPLQLILIKRMYRFYVLSHANTLYLIFPHNFAAYTQAISLPTVWKILWAENDGVSANDNNGRIFGCIALLYEIISWR